MRLFDCVKEWMNGQDCIKEWMGRMRLCRNTIDKKTRL